VLCQRQPLWEAKVGGNEQNEEKGGKKTFLLWPAIALAKRNFELFCSWKFVDILARKKKNGFALASDSISKKKQKKNKKKKVLL
jgi:hypothetical protein